jgi:hypothetical protein
MMTPMRDNPSCDSAAALPDNFLLYSGTRMDAEPPTYRRDQLYEEVWSEPVRAVARRYGVSDVALAKACRKLCLPLPGRGYWAKQKVGKAPTRPPLPLLLESTPSEILVRGRSTGAVMRDAHHLLASEAAPEVVVGETLDHPHQLVAAAERKLRQSDSPRPRGPDEHEATLDIRVSQDLLDRALRIADALLKALEEEGLSVDVVPLEWHRGMSWEVEPGGPKGTTRVLCGGEWLSFAITEPHVGTLVPPPDPPRKRTPDGWIFYSSHYEYECSGRLSLSLTNDRLRGTRHTWQDGKRQQLEDCLGSFIAHLPAAAAAIRAIREEHRVAELERAEQRRRWEAKVDRELEQKRREEKLVESAARWRLARDLREYADDIAATLAALKPATVAAMHLREQLSLARERAARIDPLGQFRPDAELP